MPKSTAPEWRTRPPMERMWKIHSVIKEGKYPNARTLADELEVTRRTIMRDIEFMRERLRLPIGYDDKRWGFYYTEEVAHFPSIQISEGELVSLLVAEKALEQYRGTSFEKPLKSAFQKLSESMPNTISVDPVGLDKSISFRTSAESVVDLEVFDALARATTNREQLRLLYRKPGSKIAEPRVVDPYHLANVNGEWFLFAYCHMRKDIRTFVPARIRWIDKTGRRFKRHRKFSLKEQLKGSFGVHSGRGAYRVVIRFAPLVADYIREKKWHHSQKLRNLPDGGVEIELKLSSLAEVRRWVLSWGGNAQVVTPKELLNEVREEAQRLLQRHRGKTAG